MAASLRIACLLYGAVAVAGFEELDLVDSTSLVQVGIRRVIDQVHSDGACTCLNWASVYSSGMAKVGDAKEYLPHGPYQPYADIKNNYCLKFDFASHSVEDYTWCYVPATCTSLQGGQKVNAQVSWKTCNKEQDTLFAELPPREMVTVMREIGWMKDPTLIPVSSYPYATFVWDDVASFYGLGKKAVEPSLLPWIQVIRAAKTPMVICDSLSSYGNGHPDACGPPNSLKLVAGDEVWEFSHFGEPICKKGCQ